jgi:hypothetical protein
MKTMLIDPSNCPHDVEFRRADGESLCLKCMTIAKDRKKNDTIRIVASEDINTEDVGPAGPNKLKK